MWSTIVLIGIGSILAAIVGGGVKLAVVEVGKVPSLRRQMILAAFGLVLIIGGLTAGGELSVDFFAGDRPSAPTAEREALKRPGTSDPRPASPNQFDDCGGAAWCPRMIRLPAGSFPMGSPDSEGDREGDEGPQRQVQLRTFAAGKYEITFDQWDACVADGGCEGRRPGDGGFGRGLRPLINVSWHGAVAYVNWLSHRTGRNYRLLTEAEWEYAARAGSTSPWPWGQDPNGGCRFANMADLSLVRDDRSYSASSCNDGIGAKTAIVGTRAANAFGLYDLIGNVWEWTQDCYVNTYEGAPADGSAVSTGDCNNRVHRGGAWDTTPIKLRSAYRNWWDPSSRNHNLGFRVARSL